jgi:hypothetical protein
MKKLLVVLLLVCVTLVNAEEKKFGKEITVKEKTSITKILSAPDKFEGKTVLVEGKVLGVCEEKGCWIEMAGTKENEKIKVKVEDGAIVFPKDSKGKTALVQGIVAPVKNEVCDEKEMADKKEASCCSKDKTKKTYQIEGLGAVIR